MRRPAAVAIYLDEYHVSADAVTDRVRGGAHAFHRRGPRPSDLLVVMKPLDSLLAIRLTEDREAARKSIQGFEGRKGDYEPRNAYERNFIAGTPARIEAARNQVALSALNALADSPRRPRRPVARRSSSSAKVSAARSGGVARSIMPTLETVIRSANRRQRRGLPVDPRERRRARRCRESGSAERSHRNRRAEPDRADLDARAAPGRRRICAGTTC